MLIFRAEHSRFLDNPAAESSDGSNPGITSNLVDKPPEIPPQELGSGDYELRSRYQLPDNTMSTGGVAELTPSQLGSVRSSRPVSAPFAGRQPDYMLLPQELQVGLLPPLMRVTEWSFVRCVKRSRSCINLELYLTLCCRERGDFWCWYSE